MATKKYCLSPNGNISDASSDQFNNLNLNQNNKCLSVDTISSKNFSDNNDDTQARKKLSLRENGYNKKLPTEYLSISDFGDKEVSKHSNINNSTLSLHIAAYENLIEASNELSREEEGKGDDFKVKESRLTKQWKNSKQIFTDSSIAFQNPFEFSRQQEDENMKPEVMQFKASQKLLNPNLSEEKMDTTNELPSSPSKAHDVASDTELPSVPHLEDKPEQLFDDKTVQKEESILMEQDGDKQMEQVDDKAEKDNKPLEQIEDKSEQPTDESSVAQNVLDSSLEHKFEDYYDLPVKRMVFGDLNFPVLNDVLRIKGNNVCLRIIYAPPPEGTKPDRRHCLQIQLSFSHIHKFMFLAPESSNGATAIALAISDVAVLRINGALFSATGEKPAGHPSRRYIFFDLLFNHNNPSNRVFWKEVLRYISYGYNLHVHKRLSDEKKVLSEKDYLELEKNLRVSYIGFIKKETMIDLLKFSDIIMEVTQDKKDGLDYITFESSYEQQAKAAEKRKEPNHITISDTSIPRLDKHDIIQQESASGRIEFNSNDLALLNPNAWLNDKIVDWYCYHLLKLVPEEKRKRIRLCETHFYTSITKGIENETNPTRLKAGIYQNYDPKKFKHSFFESDFIAVPIHRLNHWFLVVIIDPKAAICQVDPSNTSEEVSHCHFLIFDSFKKLATNEHDITFDHLTYFLARHYDAFEKVFPKDMPQQTNADDCGVYSLMFLKFFFDHLPDDSSLPDFTEWWKTFTIQGAF
uniref:Ubiquitin-like protease family profile domain-containing protein n=1 Tax=Panagrolaimus sp. ES5 TaxID=591445 RepID=A0AC34F869_9BILA